MKEGLPRETSGSIAASVWFQTKTRALLDPVRSSGATLEPTASSEVLIPLTLGYETLNK